MRVLKMIIAILIFAYSSTSLAAFTMKSAGFADKGTIPNIYTCEAGNHSPELTWDNPPANTQSFAILFTSLDSPIGLLYNWVLYNIPKEIRHLPSGIKNLPEGTRAGQNTFEETAYRGPCPVDERLHRYEITIYALDAKLTALENTRAEEVIKEMSKHILGTAKLTGVFKH